MRKKKKDTMKKDTMEILRKALRKFLDSGS